MTWDRLLLAPWLVFAVWWWVRAFGTARTVERESLRSRLTFAVPTMAGSALLFYGRLRAAGPLAWQLWPTPQPLLVVALAIECAGIAFTIWARQALGKLWSGNVTLKEGHRVVRSGPYRYVRHPIYSGILLALAGLVLAHGNLGSLLALPLILGGLRYKITVEERLLVRHFGDEYHDYRRHVRALIPFIL
jgi:protein-S-isoprenylcysteine O-methyltransferase Ste14